MTSLHVPEKFYQTCRLCLTVVSDTKSLQELSVFGDKLNHRTAASPTAAKKSIGNRTGLAQSAISDDVAPAIADAKASETKGNNKSIAASIVNRESISSADDSNNATNYGEHARLNNHQMDDEVCNNNNIDMDNSDCGDCDDGDEKQQRRSNSLNNINISSSNNNNNIDDDINKSGGGSSSNAADYCVNYGHDESQLEILEQIHTFLAISVSHTCLSFVANIVIYINI